MEIEPYIKRAPGGTRPRVLLRPKRVLIRLELGYINNLIEILNY